MSLNIKKLLDIKNVSEYRNIYELEEVAYRCSLKKVFLQISQNSRENTCARVSFLIKLQALSLRPATSLKKKLGTGVFL